MRAFDQVEIKQELSKFINLLQTDYNPNPVSTPPEVRTNGALNKKLSIIFSASEPQSSSLDKENSNPSANRSFSSTQKQFIEGTPQQLLSILLSSDLAPSQLKIVEKIRDYVQELRMENERLGFQLKKYEQDLGTEKKVNDEMLGVLMKLDEQEKQLWGNFNSLSKNHQQLVDKHRESEQQLNKAKETILSLTNDNDFMKKLIYHANESYEALEKKCCDLETYRERSPGTDRKSIKKSSTDNLLKSAKTKKNRYSPCRSQLGRSPSPQNFQEVYRKMIIRTLKFKGKNPHH